MFVSVEGIPERQSISYRVACLLYESILSHEYRDALKSQRFRINFVAFEISAEEAKLLTSNGRACLAIVVCR